MSLYANGLSLRRTETDEASFSLRLESGGAAYIIAPTGCGKTRIARHLCGLDHAVTGRTGAASIVEWEGRPLGSLDARMRAGLFAYLPSIPQLLFSLVGRSLRQELQLGFAMLGRAVDESHLERIVDMLELKPILERDPREFSGGELMRSAVACALVKTPKVVIADQIADQVDPEFRRKLAKILEQWCKEEGGILVSFAATFREEFPREAEQCVFFTGKEIIAGRAEECWRRLGSDAANYFDGVPRLGSILCKESLAVLDSMPETPADLTSALRSHSADKVSMTAPSANDRVHKLCVSIGNFGYAHGDFHLRHVTLNVRGGTLAAVLGHNGAGKTTLLKCIGNLIGPWEGSVACKGQRYDASLSLPDTARMAMYCFQNPDDQIYRQTVREELEECARNLHGGRYDPTAEDIDLAKRLGLEPYFERPPSELPLSLRRLLVIGSCLVARPPVLLLDEPTAWLDAFQKEALKLALSDYLKSGGCGLMVSHDMEFVSATASSLVFLSRGTVQHTVDGPVMSGNEPDSYKPTSLKVAECLPGLPKLWREPNLIESLRHAQN